MVGNRSGGHLRPLMIVFIVFFLLVMTAVVDIRASAGDGTDVDVASQVLTAPASEKVVELNATLDSADVSEGTVAVSIRVENASQDGKVTVDYLASKLSLVSGQDGVAVGRTPTSLHYRFSVICGSYWELLFTFTSADGTKAYELMALAEASGQIIEVGPNYHVVADDPSTDPAPMAVSAPRGSASVTFGVWFWNLPGQSPEWLWARHVRVELWKDISYWPDSQESSGYTDMEGKISFSGLDDGDTYYLKVYSENGIADVKDADWYAVFSDTYCFESPHWEVHNGGYYSDECPGGDRAALFIADCAMDDMYWLWSTIGVQRSEITIEYPSPTIPFTDSLDVSFYNIATDQIWIHPTDERLPQWSRRTVYHEYGHAIQGAFGSLLSLVANHNYFTVSDPNSAFTEGWAEFVSVAVADYSGKDDIDSTRADQVYLIENHPMTWTDNGDIVEGAIAGLMWDLYDGVDATDYPGDDRVVAGVDLYGWDDRHVGDFVDSRLDLIWNCIDSDGDTAYALFDLCPHDYRFWALFHNHHVAIMGDPLDSVPPTNPTYFTGSPPTGSWSCQDVVDVALAGYSDDFSGVWGFWYSFADAPADPSSDTWSFQNHIVSGALPEGTWYLNIRARDYQGNLATDYVSFGPWLVKFIPPTEPQNPVATGGHNQVTLRWDSPGHIYDAAVSDYCIYRAVDDPLATPLFLGSVLGTVHVYKDRTALYGHTYYYQVSALNSAGEGPLCVKVSATPAPGPWAPGTAPIDIVAWFSDDSVALTWEPPLDDGGSNITGYALYLSSDSSGPFYRYFLNSPQTWIKVEGIPVSARGYLKLAAINAVGEGPASHLVGASFHDSVPSYPMNLEIVAGRNGVDLEWDAPLSDGGRSVLRYQVLRGTEADDMVVIDETTATSFIDFWVPFDSGHYYAVRAVNSLGTGPACDPVWGAWHERVTVPGSPGHLRISGALEAADLAWDASAENGAPIISYRVYRGTDPTHLEMIGIAILAATTYHDQGLVPGRMYYYCVAGVNSEGEGPNSSVAAFMAGGKPSAPSSPIVVPRSGAVKIAWSAPEYCGAGITYQLRRDGALVYTGPYLSFDDVGLANGVSYSYRVRALNSYGESLDSTPTVATPLATMREPGGVPSLNAVANTMNVTLTWTAAPSQGTPATAYDVYRSTTSGSYTQWASFTTSSSRLVLNDTTGVPGTTYYYIVRARNGYGSGIASPEASAIAPAPGAPAAPSMTVSASLRNAQLSWLSPSNHGSSAITAYHVYRSLSSNGQARTLVIVVSSDVLSYLDRNLSVGTYYYQVGAVNLQGEGLCCAYSQCVISVALPGAPSITAVSPGDKTLHVTWNAPSSDGGSPITSYKVRWWNAQGSWNSVVTGSEFTIADIEQSKSYNVTVTATTLAGDGPASSIAAGTTTAAGTGPGGDTLLLLLIGIGAIALIGVGAFAFWRMKSKAR